jgi:hypothetical protein
MHFCRSPCAIFLHIRHKIEPVVTINCLVMSLPALDNLKSLFGLYNEVMILSDYPFISDLIHTHFDFYMVQGEGVLSL